MEHKMKGISQALSMWIVVIILAFFVFIFALMVITGIVDVNSIFSVFFSLTKGAMSSLLFT